jgi:protein arginine kinase activator
MLCESCGERDATIHLTQMVDGAVKELHMCEDCAEQSGLNVHGPLSLTDMLFGMGMPSEAASGVPDKSCPHCHMRRSDFKKTSRLGCPACYEAFAEELTPLLAAVHKGTHHIGKIPAGAIHEPPAEIVALQKQLSEAVAGERYEDAARLRDLIRQEKKKKAGRAGPQEKAH